MLSAWALAGSSQVRLFIVQKATESIGPSSARVGVLVALGCVKDRRDTAVSLFMNNKQWLNSMIASSRDYIICVKYVYLYFLQNP